MGYNWKIASLFHHWNKLQDSFSTTCYASNRGVFAGNLRLTTGRLAIIQSYSSPSKRKVIYNLVLKPLQCPHDHSPLQPIKETLHHPSTYLPPTPPHIPSGFGHASHFTRPYTLLFTYVSKFSKAADLELGKQNGLFCCIAAQHNSGTTAIFWATALNCGCLENGHFQNCIMRSCDKATYSASLIQSEQHCGKLESSGDIQSLRPNG